MKLFGLHAVLRDFPNQCTKTYTDLVDVSDASADDLAALLVVMSQMKEDMDRLYIRVFNDRTKRLNLELEYDPAGPSEAQRAMDPEATW